ncbi:MAG: RdgB/HAM1 family non-canonical purine NTP pyrophosphatase [Sphingobacteriales bacterium]|jgi:XTP/dITP diphosphohydrolase|nr:RdgB/HAM1 family non-canonical purine NTP pyrophosphatase [Sphingobacteriales bacterium]
MPKLIFASHNTHKAKEISSILQGLFEVVTLNEIGFTEEIIESGSTLEENAAIKANAVYAATQLNCFADDTGLLVAALDGAPGVHTARYAGPARDAEQNNNKLLLHMKDKENREARFVSIIHLIYEGKSYGFEGVLQGTISADPMGSEGFGYDPIFIPLGFDRTLAQMSLQEKNSLSHRAIAFQKMLEFLKEKLA